ncbi:MAG: alpha/beta hydrolase, partial [Crocinitomicaceae bacterium]|nr:alpha/beta hydrolase [Crocinitomicaceae bacterium]
DGGSIALIAAGKYPNRFQGVITEGAHIFVEEITLEGIREAKEIYQTTNLHQKLEKYHGEKTEAMFKAWSDTWLTEEFRHWNIEAFLPGIICPVLVMQGEEDEYGSLKQVEGIASQVSGGCEVLVLPNVKHTPHKEVPDQILEKSANFIAQLKIPIQ